MKDKRRAKVMTKQEYLELRQIWKDEGKVGCSMTVIATLDYFFKVVDTDVISA